MQGRAYRDFWLVDSLTEYDACNPSEVSWHVSDLPLVGAVCMNPADLSSTSLATTAGPSHYMLASVYRQTNVKVFWHRGILAFDTIDFDLSEADTGAYDANNPDNLVATVRSVPAFLFVTGL